MAEEGQKKKRKWDVDVPASSPAQQQQQQQQQQNQQQQGYQDYGSHDYNGNSNTALEPYYEDIEINDLRNRHLMIRPQVHEAIKRETGATIYVDGKYIPNKNYNPIGDRPLYIHVGANTEDALKKGVTRVREMIDQAIQGNPVPAAHSTPRGIIVEKVIVDVEGSKSFVLKPRLVGPGGSYIKHIQMTSGARVQLRGIGSGYIDPVTQTETTDELHFYITSPNDQCVAKARELCTDLIRTLKEDKDKHQLESIRRRLNPQQHGSYQPPQQQNPFGASFNYPPAAAPAPAYGGAYQNPYANYQNPGYAPGYPGYPPNPYPDYQQGYNQQVYAGYNPYNPYSQYNPYAGYPPYDPNAGNQQQPSQQEPAEGDKSYSNVPPPADHYANQNQDPLYNGTGAAEGTAEGEANGDQNYNSVPPPENYQSPEDPSKKRKL